jgi:hypothetical protein
VASASVVEGLDEVEGGVSCFGFGGPGLSVDELCFEGFEEGFADGVDAPIVK